MDDDFVDSHVVIVSQSEFSKNENENKSQTNKMKLNEIRTCRLERRSEFETVFEFEVEHRCYIFKRIITLENKSLLISFCVYRSRRVVIDIAINTTLSFQMSLLLLLLLLLLLS